MKTEEELIKKYVAKYLIPYSKYYVVIAFKNKIYKIIDFDFVVGFINNKIYGNKKDYIKSRELLIYFIFGDENKTIPKSVIYYRFYVYNEKWKRKLKINKLLNENI